MSPLNIITGALVSLLAFSSHFGLAMAHETTPEHNEEHQIEALLAQISDLTETVSLLKSQLLLAQEASASGTTLRTPIKISLSRNLAVGDRGSDVTVLQQFLNSDARTKVALNGAGSPGNETDYFGNLTAQAVIAFQELHREEILVPVGLVKGSGYVGPSTRAFINKYASSASVPSSITQPATILPPKTTEEEVVLKENTSFQNQGENFNTANLPENKNKEFLAKILETGKLPEYEEPVEAQFAIGSFSSYEAPPGTSIKVGGRDLKNSLVIQFDANTTVAGTVNADGTEFTFVVPNIPYGFYTPLIQQDGEYSSRQIDFVVTYPSSRVPEIYRISPSIGRLGSKVTIYGNNFTRSNNIIEFGYDMGSFDGIPSPDGRTITFIMNPDTILVPSQSGFSEWPVNIRVINGNGMSKEEGLFIIRI